MTVELILNGPEKAPLTIVLAHGAGAPASSPYMAFMAEKLAENGFRVARFNFPYMAEREQTGKKRPPNPQRVLLACWTDVIASLGGPDRVVIGGKSMGGRMASLMAVDLENTGTPVKGLVCLGYPFHPPGRPEKTRTEHLADIKTPMLVCQGTRDTFGTEDDVRGYQLSDTIRFVWLEDGDHGLKPRKKSGRTEEQNLSETVAAITDFVQSL